MRWHIRRLAAAAVVAAVMIAGGPLSATTMAPVTMDLQASEAGLIFRGKVRKVEAFWQRRASGTTIRTRVEFTVTEVFKGAAGATKTLVFPGGRVGDQEMAVAGVPRFKIGDEAVLFVSASEKEFCPLVGWQLGRYPVVKGASGEELVETGGVSLSAPIVRDDGSVVRPARPDVTTLERFSEVVRRKVAAVGGR